MLALFAALAGAGLVAGLDVILGAILGGGLPELRQRLFLVFTGDAALALLLGLWCARRRWIGERAFWAGAFLAAGPLIGQWLGGIWLGLPLGLLGPFLAAHLRLSGVVPVRALLPLAAAAVLVPPLALFGMQPSRAPLDKPGPPPLNPATGPKPAQPAPDVLLIVCDTLRADAVIDPALDTPAFDRMRARGAWATAGSAPCNQTLPSHLSLLTGLDIEKVGMRNNLHRWPTAEQLRERWNCVPLAERFRRAGYRTAAVVSNPLLSMVDTSAGHQEFREGFETWDGHLAPEPWRSVVLWMNDGCWLGYLTNVPLLRPLRNRSLREILEPNRIRVYRRSVREGERTLEGALAYLDELSADPRPYFLMVHFMDPHSPYVAPEPFRGRRVDPQAPPDGLGVGPEWEYDGLVELRRGLRDGVAEAREQELAVWLHDLYREEVLFLDHLVGRLAERVDQAGRPALVLFTADHGESFGEHLEVEHGGSLYEDQVAIPFLLYGPGVAENQKLDGQPELIDAARTLLELAGVDASGVDGANVLAGAPAEPGLSLMLGRAAVALVPWKMHFRLEYQDPPEVGGYRLEATELYRLDDDPGEARNLLPEHPDLARQLEAALRTRLERDLLPYLMERQIPQRHQENLGELGYAEGEH